MTQVADGFGGTGSARRSREFDDGVVASQSVLLRHATKLTKDPDRAADLVQETILRALANHASFETGTNLEAWLNRILFNSFASSYRKRKREVEDPDDLHASRLSVPASQQHHVELGEVRARIRSLPKHMKDCLALIVGGVSYEDAAERSGCAVGTVKSRVNRAREYLAGENLIPDPETVAEEPMGRPLDRSLIKDLFVAGASVSEIAAKTGFAKTDVLAVVARTRRPRQDPQVRYLQAAE